MPTIFAQKARIGARWGHNVRLDIADGIIVSIEPNTTPGAGDYRVDTLLPALANLHSHSFQRAMAGMSEYRAAGKDSFWTWRTLMYAFAKALNPDQIEAIAALVFMEMQEAGYASVGEFHYLHHQPDGTPYAAQGELSHRIFAAATQTGIGLTHLPVLYTYGGAGMAGLLPGQDRFAHKLDRYLDLISGLQSLLNDMPADTQIGIAPHSLRATAPDDLKQLVAQVPKGPVHIHISEQPQEVRDISNWLGARPVEWLLDHLPVDERWCLIHATHMTDAETCAMAKTGAVAGLCPITEANLGDGPFNGPTYLAAGGAFGLGSDSNINISLTEELRTLEYSQRLRDLRRNLMVPQAGSVGETLYLGAARGGAQALGRAAGEIAVGRLADLVSINSQDPTLIALSEDRLLDGLCFAAKDHVVTDVWSSGRHQVKDGQHIAREAIVNRYQKTITELIAVI